jgi:hypothetical protein
VHTDIGDLIDRIGKRFGRFGRPATTALLILVGLGTAAFFWHLLQAYILAPLSQGLATLVATRRMSPLFAVQAIAVTYLLSVILGITVAVVVPNYLWFKRYQKLVDRQTERERRLEQRVEAVEAKTTRLSP